MRVTSTLPRIAKPSSTDKDPPKKQSYNHTKISSCNTILSNNGVISIHSNSNSNSNNNNRNLIVSSMELFNERQRQCTVLDKYLASSSLLLALDGDKANDLDLIEDQLRIAEAGISRLAKELNVDL
eukprot:Awhi_evm1s14917